MHHERKHDMEQLTEAIKEKALALGFSKVGIASVGDLSGETANLSEWLARKYHGTMDWMERGFEKRNDPRAVVPNARSVIAVAMNYYADVVHSNDPDVGKISRYAWGDDYHDVMKDRLEKLYRFITEEAAGSSGRYYVDTGPVMDKVWAARAGLGWQGKHTNLITKEFGSWVFLGEIITDLELESDAPMTDFCGTCTACIEACPTKAIVEPYKLDATKCISYLTIEHHGEIPNEINPQLDNWVYGCDICQDVCPWNSFQQETDEPAFRPREANMAPPLEQLAQLSQEDFSERFRRSPVKRTKREGLIRNARAAMAGKKV